MEKQDVSQAAKKIRLLMQEKKYKEVVKIADGLSLNRINNGLLILDIVEAYEKQGNKKAAKQALLNYYDVHGITGRNMMQKLIELCIETRDISNAVGLCMEFENEWPESSISYLMRYQITASAGGSLDERIYYLEKYKEAEFEERWGYELAKLYDKNNQKEKCADVCHEIICFFGTGKYVEKAVQLKERVAGLTEDEINIVEAAKRREEEARERREEEERLAREEMARMAEEEERRNREYEERRIQEEQYRRQEEERQRQEEEDRRRMIEEEQRRFQKENDIKGRFAFDAYEKTMSGGTGLNRYEKSMDAAENIIDEEYAAWKARQAEAEKIRQTEAAARVLKEKKEAERYAREQKIAEALKVSDRYAQIEKNKSESIYFDEIIKNQKVDEDNSESKKHAAESGGIFSSFGRMASNVKKTLQPDEDYLEKSDADAEVEYITIGRESQAYAEDVEERMLSELDMLDDEQIDELSSTQIKEIYELKILRDVRESIKDLIAKTDSIYHVEKSREEQEKSQRELERFVNSDPYANPLDRDKEQISDSEEVSEEKAALDNDEKKEAIDTEDIYRETDKGVVEEENEETAEEVEETVEETEEAAEEVEETAEETAVAAAEPEKNVESAEETAVEEAVKVTEETEPEELIETAGKAEPEGIAETAEKGKPETPGETIEEGGSETSGETIEEGGTETSGETIEEGGTEISGETIEEGGSKASGETAEEVESEKIEETTEGVESEKTAETAEETELEESVGTAGKDEPEVSVETAEESEAGKEENAAKEFEQEKAVKHTILDRISDPDENLTVKEFSECVAAYAETKGYQIEDSTYITIAVLADEMQQKNAPLSLNNARILTDDAIARIQKRNPLDKIVDRYSKKHAHLLKDKHFYWKY